MRSTIASLLPARCLSGQPPGNEERLNIQRHPIGRCYLGASPGSAGQQNAYVVHHCWRWVGRRRPDLNLETPPQAAGNGAVFQHSEGSGGDPE